MVSRSSPDNKADKFAGKIGVSGYVMATESEEIAHIVYLDRPISRAILAAIGDFTMALSQVVSETGYPREEVATWLLDMEKNGLISHSIELPDHKAEAVFSLSTEGRLLLHRLAA